MSKFLFFILLTIVFFSFIAKNAHATEDPRSVPNNKFGVHILFTSELGKAKDLVNSSKGDWGYVTIPIQAGDKNIEKWQNFMDDAGRFHLIPIIRIATENYFFNTRVWRKPDEADVLDFANFLNSLEWPVKNRYIVVFNEVNRGDEWGGTPSPIEYAEILSFAAATFKSLSPDFFIISAGLDNASANTDKSINQYDFITQMNQAIPGIFSEIDGLGSHSYPNPAFSKPPWVVTNNSISSFKFERELAKNLSNKELPVFITETGWSSNKLSKNQISSYFTYAFESVWSDDGIVAVTPFLLQAGTEPFLQFSLLDKNGDYNEISNALQKITKIKGEPRVNNNKKLFPMPSILKEDIPLRHFPERVRHENSAIEKVNAVTEFLRWIFKLSA